MQRTRGAWIRWAGKPRLALIKTERADNLAGAIGGWSDPKFVAWVPDNLRAFVIAKTEREFGPLETMDHPSGEKSIHDLQQITPFWPPPKPARQSTMAATRSRSSRSTCARRALSPASPYRADRR